MAAAIRRTLPSGLRVVVAPLPHVHKLSLLFMVRAGPRYESPSTAGLSHLLEHLLFRGTRRHRSSFALSSAVESLGGEMNGTTHRDATSLQLELPPEALPEGVDILADLVLRPRLRGLEIERDVVLEELAEGGDDEAGELDLDDVSRRLLWGGHPLSQPILGRAAQLERYDEDDCRAHHARLFVGDNAVLAVAGPVDAEAAIDRIARAFEALPRGHRPLETPPPRPRTGLPIHLHRTDDAQVSLLMSFPAPAERAPDFPALVMLRRLLDDGLASRLRQDICERRGLAYSVGASMDVYADAGVLDLEAQCSPGKTIRTVAQLLRTAQAVCQEGVGAAELARARRRHEVEARFALDDATELAGWYAAAELIGGPADHAAHVDEVARVSAEAIVELARTTFTPERALLTAAGPLDDERSTALEALLGRPPQSTVWLGEEAEDGEEESDEDEDEDAPELAAAG